MQNPKHLPFTQNLAKPKFCPSQSAKPKHTLLTQNFFPNFLLTQNPESFINHPFHPIIELPNEHKNPTNKKQKQNKIHRNKISV
jgi:hypothetical protein